MKYIKFYATENETAEERCKAFSRALYRLTRPVPQDGDVTEFLFGFVTHEDEAAVECDPDTVIPVHQDADLDSLAEFGVEGLEPGPVPFDSLSDWYYLDREELVGWFPEVLE